MPNSNSAMIHKLQNAINSRGYAILYNKTQFWSEEQKRPIPVYTIKQIVSDPAVTGTNNKKKQYVELFKSNSQIQIVLFLRDFWYEINGWKVPTDNEIWNEAKQKYYDKKVSGERGTDAKGL